MTVYCLDTSVAVYALDRHPPAAQWFDVTTSDPTHQIVGSRVLRTELTRFLLRDDRPVQQRNEILAHVDLMPLTERVLAVAEEAIPRHLKTLDAIHLATAIVLGPEAIVVSHDEALRNMAHQLGLNTFDPLAPAGQ